MTNKEKLKAMMAKIKPTATYITAVTQNIIDLKIYFDSLHLAYSVTQDTTTANYIFTTDRKNADEMWGVVNGFMYDYFIQ